jgi:single-stranded DNA-binding protein
MNCLNRIHLIGHLGKEPELKTLFGGYQVCTLKLATSENYKDKARSMASKYAVAYTDSMGENSSICCSACP